MRRGSNSVARVRGGSAALALCAALCAASWAPAPAQAQSPFAQGFAPETARPAPGRSAGVSLEEAVRRIEAETGGRVLSAQTERRNGRAVHRIKVLTDDRRVRTYRVDADGGRR
jgi:hypothetical protein